MVVCLVLHGYNQSADIIARRMREILPQDISLVIPNGVLSLGDSKYGWFPLSKEEISKGQCTVEETDLENINITGEYDCVIGFSQGCMVATYLLAHNRISSPKLLLFSPIPLPTKFLILLDSSIKCKGFIGKKDDLVSPIHSETFVNSVSLNPMIYHHAWGHVIPTKSEYKKIYSMFILAMNH